MTIGISPVQWCDEAQIVDYGRVLVQGGGSESIGVTTISGKQHLQVGVLSTRTAYWVTILGQFDYRANRLACILGALLACLTFVFYRYRCLGERLGTSSLIGLTLFCNPLFVAGFKGGRWDWLVLMAVVLGFWSIGNFKSSGNRWFLFIAGLVLMLSPFCWISAILLLPVMFWKIFNYCGLQWRLWAIVFLGGLLTFMMVVFFHWSYLIDAISFVRPSDESGVINRVVNGMVKAPKQMGLGLVGILGVIMSRKWKASFLFIIVVVFLMVLLAGSYQHRLVYSLFALYLLCPVSFWKSERTILLGLTTVLACYSGLGRVYIAVSNLEGRVPSCSQHDEWLQNSDDIVDIGSDWCKYWEVLESGKVPYRMLKE